MISRPLVLLAIVLGLIAPLKAEEAAAKNYEYKILAVSPDKKFAMRIKHDPGAGETGEIDSAFIQAIDLVSLPDQTPLLSLLPPGDAGMTISGIKLIWSSDSKWCAFYYAFPRVGYTTILHWQAGKFVQIGAPEDILVDATEGNKDATDVRNEYVSPEKWIKPGTLLLDQLSILRTKSGEPADARFRITAAYQEQTGAFRITSEPASDK